MENLVLDQNQMEYVAETSKQMDVLLMEKLHVIAVANLLDVMGQQAMNVVILCARVVLEGVIRIALLVEKQMWLPHTECVLKHVIPLVMFVRVKPAQIASYALKSQTNCT